MPNPIKNFPSKPLGGQLAPKTRRTPSGQVDALWNGTPAPVAPPVVPPVVPPVAPPPVVPPVAPCAGNTCSAGAFIQIVSCTCTYGPDAGYPGIMDQYQGVPSIGGCSCGYVYGSCYTVAPYALCG
jgi:hypothetical protein